MTSNSASRAAASWRSSVAAAAEIDAAASRRGLDAPSSGTLATHGDGGGALDTRIMYQDARLLPWKTVLQNVMLGLGRGREARERARAVLDEVGLLSARTTGRPSCRAASGNASRWPVRSCTGRSCCCSTSRSARSTRSPASKCMR
jgi:hypothetical protein